MKKRPKVGDWVEFTGLEKGRDWVVRDQQDQKRRGFVVGEAPRSEPLWSLAPEYGWVTVLWVGADSPCPVHVDFLEKIEDNKNEN
jgi:hypothetical protein